MIYVVTMAVACALALALTPLAGRLAVRFDIVDRPGVRKIHASPVPRLGGLAVGLAVALALSIVFPLAVAFESDPVSLRPLAAVVGGAFLVFAAGLWDDISPLPPSVKLAGQFAGAAAAIAGGLLVSQVTFLGVTHDLGILAPLVTVVWIVGITNAFNLIDGLDGLAGSLIAIAASTCALVLVVRGHKPDALLLMALAGAALGFLPWNLSPARVFLGDGGAMLAGYLLATTAITGWQKGATALAVGVPLLIFALPIVDTTAAVARRLIAGQRGAGPSIGGRLQALTGILRADQRHIHHRLLALGLSERSVVLVLCALALACSLLALLSVDPP
ncbi:MAG TPA: MraY family glycosyltransferase [Methylomirabilota bacterium]